MLVCWLPTILLSCVVCLLFSVQSIPCWLSTVTTLILCWFIWFCNTAMEAHNFDATWDDVIRTDLLLLQSAILSRSKGRIITYINITHYSRTSSKFLACRMPRSDSIFCVSLIIFSSRFKSIQFPQLSWTVWFTQRSGNQWDRAHDLISHVVK